MSKEDVLADRANVVAVLAKQWRRERVKKRVVEINGVIVCVYALQCIEIIKRSTS